MRPPPTFFTLRILWVALLASNAAYLGIVFFVRAGRAATATWSDARSLAPAFALVAVGLAVVSVLLPPRLYAAGVAARTVATRDDVKDDPMGAQQGFRRPAATERVFADPAAARAVAFGAYLPPFIFGMALAEAVSLLGFVLGFLGAAPWMFVPFFAAGIALQATRCPTATGVERAFAAALGARFAAED